MVSFAIIFTVIKVTKFRISGTAWHFCLHSRDSRIAYRRSDFRTADDHGGKDVLPLAIQGHWECQQKESGENSFVNHCSYEIKQQQNFPLC